MLENVCFGVSLGAPGGDFWDQNGTTHFIAQWERLRGERNELSRELKELASDIELQGGRDALAKFGPQLDDAIAALDEYLDDENRLFIESFWIDLGTAG